MKILLIEPDEYYHAHFNETIGPLGELAIRSTGGEGKAAFDTASPDVVIMELLLPDISGFELLQELQEIRDQQLLQIIIFSKLKNLDDVQASLNFGISGYFVKGQDTISDIKKLVLTLKGGESNI